VPHQEGTANRPKPHVPTGARVQRGNTFAQHEVAATATAGVKEAFLTEALRDRRMACIDP
jgi:hypothetical protein